MSLKHRIIGENIGISEVYVQIRNEFETERQIMSVIDEQMKISSIDERTFSGDRFGGKFILLLFLFLFLKLFFDS